MKFQNDHGESAMLGEPVPPPEITAADKDRGFTHPDQGIPGEGDYSGRRHGYNENRGFYDRFEHGGFLPRDGDSTER